MPVGPQEQQLLEALAAGAAERGSLEAATMREGYAALGAIAGPGPEVDTEDTTVPGPDGDIPVRIYRPAGDGPFGVLVYLHGGGWTLGGLDTHDHPCRVLCAEASVIVVSVDYRLAPEHPFPAALDDCWAALRWVADHADQLGGRPDRIAVGGDSGGGNLAAVLALLARDNGGPELALQLLVYPVVDLRDDTVARYPSLTENAEGYVLTLEHMRFFVGNYRPDPELAHDWRVSPITATDLSGLPPALVITVGFDPLRDEGDAYAAALSTAGVEVTHHRHPTTIHGMYQLAPLLEAGRLALTQSVEGLRRALA